MTAIPRASLADSVVEAGDPEYAAHAMSQYDYPILDRNLKFATDAGGTAYRPVSAKP